MKKITLFTALSLFMFGLSGTVLSYEGGTKVVATMTHPEQGKMVRGPIFLVPFEQLAPGKLIEKYLHRIPEPTLSVQRIREEKSGESRGTKMHVRYLKEGRV